MAAPPPYPGTRLHAFRIADDIWAAATSRARTERAQLTPVVVAAVARYAAGGQHARRPPRKMRP